MRQFYRGIQGRVGTSFDGTIHTAKTYEASGEMDSHNHPKTPNGTYREGGPWYAAKTETQHVFGKGIAYTGGDEHPFKFYEGGFTIPWHPDLPGAGNVPNYKDELAWKDRDLSELNEWGAKAWNAMRPDLPDFSLANAIYELREVPGMLEDAVKDVIKNVRTRQRQKAGRSREERSGLSRTGEYFLAAEFGWIPLLGDIRDFVKTQQGYQKRLTQLIRDEGRPVKRRRVLKDEPETFVEYKGDHGSPWYVGSGPTLVTSAYGRNGEKATYHTTYQRYRRTWCEGTFRYYLPPGPHDVGWTQTMARRIFGWRVTPSMVYNAVPWSWLADYFTGLGDFIEAVSPGVADRLVADDAWLMRTRGWERKTSFTNWLNIGGGRSTSVTSARIDQTLIKMRIRASPFGFGIKNENLSPLQVAILGALGLSKLP